MAAGDKNAVPGGSPTENIAAYEDAAADRVPGAVITDEVGLKISPTNPFPVYTGILAGDGRKTKAATTGTGEALAGSTPCQLVIVQALLNNTGLVVVGTTGVEADVGTRDGLALSAGDKEYIPTDNLANVFIDVTVGGEGVSFIYFA